MFEEGQQSPAFNMPTDTIGGVSNTSLNGSPYVVYFYPKDDTYSKNKNMLYFR
ncbi:MAG: redoxin domain-containing protein [Sneathiella sp.]|nr:redoxin domain-containing protein [Sneathiella sp.]